MHIVLPHLLKILLLNVNHQKGAVFFNFHLAFLHDLNYDGISGFHAPKHNPEPTAFLCIKCAISSSFSPCFYILKRLYHLPNQIPEKAAPSEEGCAQNEAYKSGSSI